MANSLEMLRLMRHAADLLDACEPHKNTRLAADTLDGDVQSRAIARGTQEAVAIATASAVLRMVSAAMDDEPTPAREVDDRIAALTVSPEEPS